MYEYTKDKIYSDNLVYPELSYKIIGILFQVFREQGYGYKERHYQKFFELALTESKFNFKREVPVKIFYKEKFVANTYLDFLVEDKIVVELKQGDYFKKSDINQVYNYLKTTNLKLGILARYTKSGLKYKRIVNIR